jgi:hypothetical protein
MRFKGLMFKPCLTGYKSKHKRHKRYRMCGPTHVSSRLKFVFDFYILPAVTNNQCKKCLRVIGNHPRRTPTSHLHNSLNIQPISVLIHRTTDKFFRSLPLTP